MLLPETTVALVQLPDFQAAMEKMRETGTGKMMADASVSSLVDGLWEEAELAYDDVKEDVGLELTDLTSLPDGEITFAVIAPRRSNPEYMVIMDLNEEEGVLDRVMERGRELIPQHQKNSEDEEGDGEEDGFEIESFNADGKRAHFFRHGNTVVASTSLEELNDLVDRWMGREVEKTRPLASNRKFITIMKRCAGTQDLDPEFRFFVDPIAVAKSTTRGDAGARFMINLLPLLGFDSLSGIGGALFLDEEEYESVMHAHVLLTNPRTGIFALLAFRPTEYEPEEFIPRSTVNHMMVSVDAPKAYAELTKIVDSFMSPGDFENAVDKNVNQELGLDLKQDIIDSIDGRVTWFQWIEEPAILNGTRSGMAFRLKDPEKFEMLMDKMTEQLNKDLGGKKEKTSPSIEKRDYRDVTIYAEPRSKVDDRNERQKERIGRRGRRRARTSTPKVRMDTRLESPQMAIFGDCLVVSIDSHNLMQTMIDTFQGEGERLVDDLGYARIVDESQRLLNNELPMANFYSDPKRQFKWILELANTDQTQEVLNSAAEDNKYIAGIKQRLDENPLQFEQLEKYFSQSGGYMSDDDTGLHMLFFTLKLDEE